VECVGDEERRGNRYRTCAAIRVRVGVTGNQPFSIGAATQRPISMIWMVYDVLSSMQTIVWLADDSQRSTAAAVSEFMQRIDIQTPNA
jgi:hypothetical protein